MAKLSNKTDAPASPGAPIDLVKGAQKSTNSATVPGLVIQSSSDSKKVNAEDWTTAVLRFLSTASNRALGGIALGLVLFTYLALGRLGLVLIGTLGGIILHATWERHNAPGGSVEDLRREKGLDVVKRVLDWRETKIGNSELDCAESYTLVGKAFEDFRPETRAALHAFVEAVIRDYVKWWYTPIVPTDDSFPAACRQTLTSFLRSISLHLSRKRPVDTFLDFLTNSSSIAIVFLSELSRALAASQGTGISPAEAVDDYLLSNPESSLANILNEKQQAKKFKMIADDVLHNFLDKSAYKCDPVRVFLKEILASVVMEMSLTACSKPEWINGWIVYLLEEGEPELNHAIDVGMGSASVDGSEGLIGSSGSASSARHRQSEEKKHRKRLSKAEEAMEEAMEEAKRLSQLIAEDEKRRLTTREASPTDASHLKSSNVPGPAMVEEARSQPIRATSEQIGNGRDTKPPTVSSSPVPLASVGTPSTSTGSSFTSFDQIIPPVQPIALQSDPQNSSQTPPLTLHNASIALIDDSTASDKGRIRSKPSGDYLVQIEPKLYPGWITVRKFQDFETLHEILRRIALISGVTAFTEQHSSLPDWKNHTRASLRGELERYLRDACWHQELAESEGMKRFLEKDQGNMQSSGSRGIGWPTPAAFESMGKGMLDVLTSAPKGAAEGGKAVLGGVTGVLGNLGSLGQKKRESVSNFGTTAPLKSSTLTLSKPDSPSSMNGFRWGMDSEESLKVSPIIQTQPGKIAPMERKPSSTSIADMENDYEVSGKGRVSMSSRSSLSGRLSTNNSRAPSRAPSISARGASTSHMPELDDLILPPLPSDIPDDYGSNTEPSSMSHSRTDSIAATARTSTSTAPSQQSPGRPSVSATRPSLPKRPQKEIIPLTEQETGVAVELLFAIINELYTLSSAWNIRRTLLAAAKTFLLRPGNPSLGAIQSLIQDSVIASNISDAGIAQHLRKLRENTMPTEEELKAWPTELTGDEKEKLRIKARKLLIEKGMPTALTGVMGQAATGEAMGRVFDCLQVEEVTRGLMFGLLIQGVRAMTH